MELAFFLLIMIRQDVAFKSRRRLVEFVLEEARRFDWHELARFDPSSGSPLSLVADFFEVNGAPPPFEPAFFDMLIDFGFFDGMDRLPYRELEFGYAIARLHKIDVMPELLEAFGRTAFGRQHSLPRYSLDDTYSLTHALFYVTDVGLRPAASWAGKSDALRLQKTLIALITMMVRADHGDVLGELLICWIMCGFVATAAEQLVVDAGMNRMLSLIVPEGAVPPTTSVRNRLLEGRADFAEIYHTTLVASILFRLAGAGR
ncbi:hypothetical protein ETR14_19025 [Sphingosinicella sp. BN140058]|nr:hypothetical protein [Sphingosinicella sp. BN140058]QAY78394.1 hypothetical protein ETR14_19025 [Sphingosinicella sp. BN140058]